MADELCMIHFSIIVEAVVQAQLMLYALLLCTASERSFKALEQSTHMLLHTPGPYTPHSLHLPHPLHMYISSFPSHPLPHSLFPISSPTSPSLLTPFLPLSPSLMQMCWAAIVILPLGGWLPQIPGTLVTPGEQTSLTTTRQEGQHFVQSESCIQYSTESTALNQCLQ